MNIMDVLSKSELPGIKTAEKEQAVNGDLFAYLVSQFFSQKNNDIIKQSSEGQYPEGILDLLSEQNSEGNFFQKADNLLSPSQYYQILQGLVPAGKEANSGQLKIDIRNYDSSTQELLKSLSIQGNKFSIDTLSAKNILDSIYSGNTGMVNPEGQERAALKQTELDNYIKVINYLNELSGEIQNTKNNKPGIQQPQAAQIAVNKEYFNKIPNKVFSAEGFVNSDTGVPSKDISGRENSVKDLAAKTAAGAKADNFTIPGKDSQIQITNSNNDQNVMSKRSNSYVVEAVANSRNGSTAYLSVASDSGLTSQGIKPERTENAYTESFVNQEIAGKHPDFTSPVSKVIQNLPESAKVWNQVVNALKQQAIQNNREVKEMSLKLHPAELGKLQLSLKMEEGQLHLQIHASEQATGNYLQNHMQELKQSLNQLGISFGSLEMSFAGQEREQEGNYEERPKHQVAKFEEETQELLGYNSYTGIWGEKNTINVSA